MIKRIKKELVVDGEASVYELIGYPDTNELRNKHISMWHAYKCLCADSNELGFRRMNLLESITEVAFCLSTGSLRVVEGKKKSSVDCWEPETNEFTEIKACANTSAPTSWSPNSVADVVYWLDFSKLDGTYDAYRISYDLIDSVEVNSKQKFTDQQDEKRRPRFKVKKLLIDKYNLKPEFTGSIFSNEIKTVEDKKKTTFAPFLIGHSKFMVNESKIMY